MIERTDEELDAEEGALTVPWSIERSKFAKLTGQGAYACPDDDELCPDCNGRGKTWLLRRKCRHCDGVGYVDAD